MHVNQAAARFAALAALAGVCNVNAQDDSASLTVFGAQRFWFATQSAKLLDAAVAVDSATGAPLVRSQLAEANASAVVPITSLGARYGRWLGTVSLSPSTGFGSGGLVDGGQIRRQEYDLSLGYAALPSTTVLLIYKHGKATPTISVAARQLARFGNGVGTGNAVLLGVSTGAPLQGAFSIYGNLAYGGGRWTSDDGAGLTQRSSSRYTVADFGVAWRAGGAASVTVQLGYRSQTLTLKNVELPVYSVAGAPRQVAVQRVDAPTQTQGLVFSVGAAF